MPSLVLRNCRLLDDAPSAAVDVWIDHGRIRRIAPAGDPAPPDHPSLDAEGRTVAPGLVDVHVHGAGGADVLDGTEAALRTMSAALASHGVTGFLATTFLDPATGSAHLPAVAALVGADLGGARLLGLYLEGPFVNPARRGGLPADALLPPSRAVLDEVLALTGGALRLMTVAPELPGALETIERLRAAGVVPCFGHSDAGYEQTRDGLAAGIGHVTHLFNAMPGLHHRAPGPLVALHEAEQVSVELIADGVHVDGRVVRFARAAFGPERVVCVTDALRPMGLPDGSYRHAGREVESRGGAIRGHDGTLIGTSLSLLDVAHRYRGFTGCSLAEAVGAASLRPARLLGLDAGVLEPGRDADLVVLDHDLSAWVTLVGGRIVHRR